MATRPTPVPFVERLKRWWAAARPETADKSWYAACAETIAEIRRRETALEGLADGEITARAIALRGSAAAPIDAYPLAMQAIRRTLGLRVFDVQVAGALAMSDGRIAEMQTGEGKTLTAVMTVFAEALGGAGVHVWTANDYLARRDAEWMGPAYRMLGIDARAIGQLSDAGARRAAYAADVAYATGNEIGFDYLRDQIALDPSEVVQRPYALALIDECDSILIDEARIPLVIAGGAQAATDLARTMARVVAGMRLGLDYFLDDQRRNVQFTDRGVSLVEAAARCGNLFDAENLSTLTAAQDALHAHALLRRDVDYVVKNGRIELVDEFKGRIAENRRWPAGLQTALEAKEGVAFRLQGRILGSITVQNLVKLYPRVCGMTGTAATQSVEFFEIYGLRVTEIPTNKAVIRIDHPDIVYGDRLSKERAVVEEIGRAHATGRPVLVGTASVEESERLSYRVAQAGIAHNVLNARNDEAEAAIVARAGDEGAVTISTNMAGRGTDIPLGGDRVRQLGGLYVIGMNRHEARRIDNQLRGRAGRQGDPGESRFFVSLEDDLMLRYGVREALGDNRQWMRDREIKAGWVRGAIEQTQRIVEGQNLEIRRTLWKYEGLLETQRREWSDRRGEILRGAFPAIVERAAPERWAELVERFGEPVANEMERRWVLRLMDDLWADYLAAIAELRGGIHWVSWTGKDPLHTFLVEETRLYEELCGRLEGELVEAFSRDDIGPDTEIPDAFDRSATWTYLVNDQPFGTLQERWAKAVRNQIRGWLELARPR